MRDFGTSSVYPRVNWEEFVRCQVRANETYSEEKSQFSVSNRDVLVNVDLPHACHPSPYHVCLQVE